jgi:TetR/AcrR family transcriptional regulator, regulator of cefoperazone and chloramphenicol sensitivity
MEIDMRSVKKEGSDVRGRLLEIACEIFAQKGYRDATIAEICKRAGANVAAVNYYFGNKETLYVEAWRLAFHRSLEAHSPSGGVPSDAPAEERLRGRIFAIMQRLADPKSHEFEIIRKEMTNPTGLLAEVMRKSIEPLRRELGSIVRELLGEYASEQQVILCQMSIKAQCFDMIARERHHKMFTAVGIKEAMPSERPKIEVMADHITRFSLAGIHEIRHQIEYGELVSR